MIRFNGETEERNGAVVGAGAAPTAVERDVWPVGEVGARSVRQAACITLKLLLCYD